MTPPRASDPMLHPIPVQLYAGRTLHSDSNEIVYFHPSPRRMSISYTPEHQATYRDILLDGLSALMSLLPHGSDILSAIYGTPESFRLVDQLAEALLTRGPLFGAARIVDVVGRMPANQRPFRVVEVREGNEFQDLWAEMEMGLFLDGRAVLLCPPNLGAPTYGPFSNVEELVAAGAVPDRDLGLGDNWNGDREAELMLGGELNNL